MCVLIMDPTDESFTEPCDLAPELHGLTDMHAAHRPQRMCVLIMDPTDESFTEPCDLAPGNTFQKRSVSSPAMHWTAWVSSSI